MKIEIKSLAGSLLFEGDFSSLAEALVAAVKKGANLTRANLDGANLTRANLYGANLTGADLDGANLTGANLTRANLTGANLDGANLTRANLDGANLTRANLYGAKIPEKDFSSLYAHRTITPEGNLIGWKKLRNGTICRLLIPTDAKRVGGLIGRKCRAEFARVLDGSGISWTTEHDAIAYAPGKIVRPDRFDPDPRVECSNGVHFFLTRQEAEEF